MNKTILIESDKHINSLEFKNDIVKLGYILDDEKIWLLRNCHSLIALPIYEGFGISALEGLFFGKKVLVSNNGSLKEVVGRAGFLANPFDIEDMEKKMIEISKLRGNPKKEYISERLKVYDQKVAAERLVELLVSV